MLNFHQSIIAVFETVDVQKTLYTIHKQKCHIILKLVLQLNNRSYYYAGVINGRIGNNPI